MAEFVDTTDKIVIPNCPICMETLKNPRSLPCLHAFCESCIGKYIASVSKGESGLSYSFPCPYCRADTKLTRSIEHVGGDARKLVETSSINDEHLFPVESEKCERSKTCEVCLLRGFESVSATCWCQDCQEALCDSCEEYHQSMKGLKSHKIMKIEETHHVTNENGFRWCPEHAMDLTFFCFSHEQPCCMKCAATKHRVCDSVEELEVILQDPDFSGKTREMEDELNRIHSDLSAVLQNREQNAARLGKQHLDIKEKVTLLRNTLVDHIERMTALILSEASNKQEKESSIVEGDFDWLRVHQQLVSYLLTKIQEVRQGLELDRFRAYREIQKNMATLKTELPEKLAGMYESDLHFVPNGTSDVILNNFSKFGLMTVKKESCKLQSFSSDSAKQHMYALKSTSSFKVSIPGEKALPRIRSVLFVEGQKLLMVDVDNKSLKLYDIKGTLLHRVSTQGKPGFLTRMKGNRYVVTEPDVCKISVYELSKEIKLISSIQSPEDILGIAFLNEVFILTCKDCVRIIDQNGECLQYLDKNSKGDQMFSSIKYILGDPFNNVVYISDGEKNNVFAFKQYPPSKLLKQKPLYIYAHPKLINPTGIAIDKFKNLLVCGNSSSNIHLFDREGKHLKIICSSVTGPLNLEWDSYYNNLVLSVLMPQFQIQFFEAS